MRGVRSFQLILGLGLGLAAAISTLSVAHADAPADPNAPDDGSGGATNVDQTNPDAVPGLSDTSPSIVPTLVAPVNLVSGPGIKVGEGTVINALIGADIGFVSNVFYDDNSDKRKGKGVFRLIAQVGTGSLSPQRLANNHGDIGMLQYRADLRATYDAYLSGESSVTAQDGLGLNATLRAVVFPLKTWQVLVFDNYERQIRAPNFETSSSVNRDVNHFSIGLQFAPRGRNLSGLLRYDNTVEIFENNTQSFANRLQQDVGLTASWRLRPVTVAFADASLGFYSGIGADSVKVSSNPLTTIVGLQTLLSLKTTLVGRVGYTNGFYSAGPSYSAVTGGVEAGYRYSQLGRVTLGYDYAHRDSINANYYRDHAIRASVTQQFVPFLFVLQPQLTFRHYAGIDTILPGAADSRDDTLLSISASLRYNFRDSLAAILQYRFTGVFTNYQYTIDGDTDDPSYSRHEVVLGIRYSL